MRLFIADALCGRNEKNMPYFTLMCTTLDPVENVTNVLMKKIAICYL